MNNVHDSGERYFFNIPGGKALRIEDEKGDPGVTPPAISYLALSRFARKLITEAPALRVIDINQQR